jgi:hypothetical protein
MDNYGAPSKEIADKAASEEISLMLELCKDHELGKSFKHFKRMDRRRN